ncbi:MAG: hypothetical protein [Microvirus sp.]|nr:MAG: hypothetical protein [Microvirus sp.]
MKEHIRDLRDELAAVLKTLYAKRNSMEKALVKMEDQIRAIEEAKDRHVADKK